jgi:hypothetical protein
VDSIGDGLGHIVTAAQRAVAARQKQRLPTLFPRDPFSAPFSSLFPSVFIAYSSAES